MITEYREYLNPSKVYIPLTDSTHKIANVHVEVGDEVLIGQLLADKFDGKEKDPVLSTISGKVIGFKEMMDRFGKVADHVIIENDKLYGKEVSKTFSGKVSAAEVRKSIKNLGLTSISIDGIQTDLKFDAKSKFVVINSMFINEPFISTDYDFLSKFSVEVSDGISLLGTAANAEKIIILVDKAMPEDVLLELGKAIVEKDIELVTVNSKNVIAKDYKVIKKLVNDKLSINLNDNGVVYTDVMAAKMVHDAVREGIPVTTRRIALTGDALKMNVIYDVRIGTQFTELVEDIGGYTEIKNMNLHIGSFLTGTSLEGDDFAITQSIDTVNVAEFRPTDEDVCIKCGDCNDICPAGILPQNIMDAEVRSVNSRIFDLNTEECVECGLCTYVCPSKINVLEWVRRAKRRVG